MTGPVKTLLTSARDIIKERGVNRDGGYVSRLNGDCLCTVGALDVAAGATIRQNDEGYYSLSYGGATLFATETYGKAYKALNDAFRVRDYQGTQSITRWNDKVATDGQVFDLYDAAISMIDDEE